MSLIARRFALPPITEAAYEPRQIPATQPDMDGSALIRPQREVWMTLLGEMVQMVNEAVRRRAKTVRDASKPLSLEYMGDRLDVDDPLHGYLVVTRKEGWLQGFLTCTTFTVRSCSRAVARARAHAPRRVRARRRGTATSGGTASTRCSR